nr:immunoglobulin heavy chain junction region [Macaca mulatta]
CARDESALSITFDYW